MSCWSWCGGCEGRIPQTEHLVNGNKLSLLWWRRERLCMQEASGLQGPVFRSSAESNKLNSDLGLRVEVCSLSFF